MKSNTRYRLSNRDIEWGSSPTGPKRNSSHSVDISPPGGRLHAIKQVIDDFFVPNIAEFLTHLSTYDLAPWQRSCQWAQIRRIHESIVRHPRALTPYLIEADGIEPYGKALILVGAEMDRAEKDLGALKEFEGSDPGEINLTTLLGRIAALALYERSDWGKQNRGAIYEEVLHSPELCYYFVSATTPTIEEWTVLAESIARCPRSSYATLRLPHLPITSVVLQPRSSLKAGVAKSAIFNWALEFGSKGNRDTTQRHKLLERDSPEACALSLALLPESPLADEWLSGLLDQPELAYKARRLLSLTGQIDAECLLAPKLGAIAVTKPQWAFHWHRDFSEISEEVILSMMPDLEWISELIDAGACPILHANAVDDAAARTMDMDHWLRSSFLLYAAGKAQSSEEND